MAPSGTFVSLTPAVTDALCRLGCRDRVCGRTRACQWPPAAHGIPVVAVPPLHPRDPPVILADPSDGRPVDAVFAPVCAAWRPAYRHARVVAVPPAATVAAALRLVATVADAAQLPPGDGRAVVEALEARLESCQARAAQRTTAAGARGERRRVAVLQGLSAEHHVYGCGHWMRDAVACAGGVCVGAASAPAAPASGGKPPILLTLDVLRELAPHAIVVGGSGRQAAEEELRESGLLPQLARIAHVYVPAEGGDAAAALSGAAKEGGALAVSAVEALAEVCVPGLMGTYGQLTRVGGGGSGGSGAALPLRSPLPPPPGAAGGPASPGYERASSCGSGQRVEWRCVPGWEGEGRPRGSGGGVVSDSLCPSEPAAWSVEASTEVPSAEAAAAATLRPAAVEDPKDAVARHVGHLRRKDWGAARAMYTREAQAQLDAASLRRLAPTLQRRLKICAAEMGGDAREDGCTAAVVVAVRDVEELRWELVRALGAWQVVGIARRSHD
eukprot:Rhum_TRINITY_DN12579_c0_g1::Rhum_TRINITY_DN12579_c0_g1_i1::g.52948::m.52948